TTCERGGAWAQSGATTLWRAIEQCDDVAPRPRAGIDQFRTAVERLRGALDAGPPVAFASRVLIDEIDLYGDIRAGTPSATSAQRRIDNAESLLRSLE